MKPRTEAQKEVDRLTWELPALTLRQAILLRQHLFKGSSEGYFHKGVARCTACGHIWNAPINTVGPKMTCPCCGSVLNMTACRKTSLKQSRIEYATISHVFRGWQVTRTYVIEQTMHANQRADYDYRCVQECWDSPKGHVLIQSSKAMGFWYCREGKGWMYNLNMLNDASYYQMRSQHDIVENTLPILRKRGYDGRAKHDMYLQPLFKNLLTQPIFESYWKRKLYDLALRFLDRKWKPDVDKAVTIFLRHNKQGWKDKNEMNDWFDMVECLKDLDKDLHSPAYVCPPNIKEAHDRWVKLRQRKRDEIERKHRHEQAIEKAKQQQDLAELYIKKRSKFNELLIHNDNIYIKVLQDVPAFIAEADEMMHCLCTNEYYNLKTHPNSLIMSARVGEAWEQRLETIEVSLKSYQIIQSRGYKNRDTPQHNEIVNLVNANMNMIRQFNSRRA